MSKSTIAIDVPDDVIDRVVKAINDINEIELKREALTEAQFTMIIQWIKDDLHYYWGDHFDDGLMDGLDDLLREPEFSK